MENKSGKREWVKTAAIVFLSILLVLTFFSNTIMNRTLPEVSTEAVASGTITAKVRGSGTVSAIGSNEVKATGTRSIAAVKIKAGQEVNEGDVLFVMGSAADEEVETAKDTYDDLYYSYLRAQANYPIYSSSSNAAVDSAWMQVEVAEANLEAAEEALRKASQDNPDVQKIKIELDAAIAVLNTAKVKTQDDIILVQSTLVDATVREQWALENEETAAQNLANDPSNPALIEAYKSAQQIYADAYSYRMSVESDLNNLVTYGSVEEQLAQAEVDALQAKYDAVLAQYSEAVIDLELAQNGLNSAISSYNSALASAQTSNASYGQSAALHDVDVQQAEHKLDRQEEKIASLTGEGEDANVYAKVSGIVESVNFSAGDTVVKDDILCTIEVPDQGYTVTISVTKEQAGRLQIGDTADISNYYWGSSITATVSSIKTDPKNPQSNKLVTFDITGDVTTGQELKIAIGQKSASYDCVVPNSAVMSDSNGKFVLTVESKQSPLGNRYFARRVDVDVLGSDDINSAVNGNIGNGDFVITTSSIHINNGDQVRLSDAG